TRSGARTAGGAVPLCGVRRVRRRPGNGLHAQEVRRHTGREILAGGRPAGDRADVDGRREGISRPAEGTDPIERARACNERRGAQGFATAFEQPNEWTRTYQDLSGERRPSPVEWEYPRSSSATQNAATARCARG